MKQQCMNPYLPGWEYIPDAELHVFGERVYAYGSHDAFGGDDYCVNDYVCWSAPVSDLSDWRYEGVIYTRRDDPQSPGGQRKMQAPDVIQGPDGRYYLYYTLDLKAEAGPTSVAVCDTPAGKYTYLGQVCWPDGRPLGGGEGELLTFDPGLIRDTDGRIYMFTGMALPGIPPLRKRIAEKKRIADGCYLTELEPDMRTIRTAPKRVLFGMDEAAGTPFEGHAFFEASSPRIIGGRYYLVYCSERSHELCYATAEKIGGPYRYGGVLVSIGDVGLQGRTEAEAVNYLGNTHGGIFQAEGRYFLGYHRQTNLIQYSRQGCAEEIFPAEDGSIPQVPVTSQGMNPGPLAGTGSYEARTACCLRSPEGVFAYKIYRTEPGVHPYLTQDSPDHEGRSDQYVANLQKGAYAGFRYFDLKCPGQISAVIRNRGRGTLEVSLTPEGEPIARMEAEAADFWHTVSGPALPVEGIRELYFRWNGEESADFFSFTLGGAK